jgi:hypothetical protein
MRNGGDEKAPHGVKRSTTQARHDCA